MFKRKLSYQINILLILVAIVLFPIALGFSKTNALVSIICLVVNAIITIVLVIFGPEREKKSNLVLLAREKYNIHDLLIDSRESEISEEIIVYHDQEYQFVEKEYSYTGKGAMKDFYKKHKSVMEFKSILMICCTDNCAMFNTWYLYIPTGRNIH